MPPFSDKPNERKPEIPSSPEEIQRIGDAIFEMATGDKWKHDLWNLDNRLSKAAYDVGYHGYNDARLFKVREYLDSKYPKELHGITRLINSSSQYDTTPKATSKKEYNTDAWSKEWDNERTKSDSATHHVYSENPEDPDSPPLDPNK
jgi:hypothetical protein